MDDRLSTTRAFRPEVGRLWLRRAFREWPASQRRWIDIAEGRVRRGGDGGPLPQADPIAAAGGLLYIPPVDRELAAARDALVESLLRRDVPLLIQLRPGETISPTGPPPEAVVVDLLETLLLGRADLLESVPRGAVALWPLLPALTDAEALWEEGCRRLALAGASCVQAVVPELSPSERRALAEGENEEALFSRLFHGRARGGERRFAATAARHGLDVFFRRPTARADRMSRNAALSELLALAAELWLRLGRSEVQGQELFRASRWVEDTAIDVRALAAEGNLEIVEALRAPAANIVGEWARAGTSATVEAWLTEYVSLPEKSLEG